MTQDASIHDRLAELLTYPAPARRPSLAAAASALLAELPEHADSLQPLATALADTADAGVEELFTRTFDNNAQRALEIGWQIHGENYDRGDFMVRMRERLREHGIEETTELPDHLSHALQLVGRMEPDEAFAFIGSSVLPALEKIEQGFGDEENPYRGVVSTAKRLLEARVAI